MALAPGNQTLTAKPAINHDAPPVDHTAMTSFNHASHGLRELKQQQWQKDSGAFVNCERTTRATLPSGFCL
jgi:hypothetical protein